MTFCLASCMIKPYHTCLVTGKKILGKTKHHRGFSRLP
jgi:hypothetical protein